MAAMVDEGKGRGKEKRRVKGKHLNEGGSELREGEKGRGKEEGNKGKEGDTKS